jgi:hypothetical protein
MAANAKYIDALNRDIQSEHNYNELLEMLCEHLRRLSEYSIEKQRATTGSLQRFSFIDLTKDRRIVTTGSKHYETSTPRKVPLYEETLGLAKQLRNANAIGDVNACIDNLEWPSKQFKGALITAMKKALSPTPRTRSRSRSRGGNKTRSKR